MQVSSAWMAAGYWRQAELTAAKFAQAPEGGDLRIYRTSLLAVVLAAIVFAFALQGQPKPLRATLVPDAFNGPSAYTNMVDLARRYPIGGGDTFAAASAPARPRDSMQRFLRRRSTIALVMCLPLIAIVAVVILTFVGATRIAGMYSKIGSTVETVGH